jgi:hypothetical protein
MRVLVVLDSRDLPQAQGLLLEDQNLSPDVFPPGDCQFEYCLFPAGQPETVRVIETGQDMTAEEVAERYGALVVVAGHHAVDNAGLKTFVRRYLLGGNISAYSNEAAIVLTLPTTGHPEFPMWPRERVFTLPSRHQPRLSDQDPSAAWVHEVRAELDGVVKTIEENQTYNPNVGFGLLVVDLRCNFFLMERLRDPGRNTLGTMGGNFERGHSIDEQLEALLIRRFGPNKRPRLELGPLLSCTNMKNLYLHYVDITFLALARGSMRGVSDDELIALRPETLDELPEDSSRSVPRFMFTLPEVAAFHRQRRLFTPVANAFESFCRTILADQLRYGRKPTVTFPSLLDESSSMTLQLPPDIDCMQTIVGEMRWSTSTIPFFEGDI